MSSEDQILVGKAVTSGKVHIGIVVVDVELFKKENQKTIFDVRGKADAKDDIIRLISKKVTNASRHQIYYQIQLI